MGILQKLMLAIAGGVSPEVAVYDERVSSYVISGLLEPLTELMRRDGITKDDFWLPCPTQRSSSAPPAPYEGLRVAGVEYGCDHQKRR